MSLSERSSDGSRKWRAAWLVVLGVMLPAAGAADPTELEIIDPMTLQGTTGLVHTPVASVMPSRTIAFGLSVIDRNWANHFRGGSDNHHYFLTVGFFPRIEASVRISYFPDGRLFREADKGTVDRGGSGRLLVLTEGAYRPAVAVGVDDVRGTRKFHALYAVATKTVDLPPEWLMARVSAGYGSTALKAQQHVLDGGFGGLEVVCSDFLSLAIDHDTEKWNGMVRFVAFDRLAARFALLNFESVAGGLAWTQSF